MGFPPKKHYSKVICVNVSKDEPRLEEDINAFLEDEMGGEIVSVTQTTASFDTGEWITLVIVYKE